MRATVIRTDAKELFGGLKGRLVDKCMRAQVVLASLVLAMDDAPRGKLSPEGEKAFERMWSIQLKSGPDQGRLAVVRLRSRSLGNERRRVLWRGAGGFGHRTGSRGLSGSPGDPENIAAHARLSARPRRRTRRCTTGCSCCGRPRNCATCCRRAISRRFWMSCGANRKPTAAGASPSLGPWKKRDAAPARSARTAMPQRLAAFTVEQAGKTASDPVLSRALAWLRTHQDPRVDTGPRNP